MSDLPLRNATTSEELASTGGVSREHVLRRLSDWRDRVHKLYDQIERQLQDTGFRCNREEKHVLSEELPRKVGIAEAEQPKIDALRIVRPDKTNAAVLQPRGLWIIGANGRVDLRIMPSVGSSEIYILLDQSKPLSGPGQWVRMPIGSPFDREPFDPRWLRSKLH
jgi:hypothetical protein